MPKEEYEKDFDTVGSKREFADLLEKAADVFELPFIEGNTLEKVQTCKESRDKQYALGAPILPHIARFSLPSGMAEQRAKPQRLSGLSWKAFLPRQRRRKVHWISSIMDRYIMFLPEEKTQRQKL